MVSPRSIIGDDCASDSVNAAMGTYVLRIITALGTLLVMASCSHEQTVAAQTSQPESAPGNLDRFGAAAWLPADYSYFSSGQNLGALIEDIVDSRTVQSLARLPMVMVALNQLQRPLQEVAGMRAQSPGLDNFFALGEEALHREIFVACGKKAEAFQVAVTNTLAIAMVNNGIASMNNQFVPPAEAIIEALLLNRKDLRVPPAVFGMRVGDRERAKALLDDLAPYALMIPGVIEEATAPAGFRAWTVKDAEGSAQNLRPMLEGAGVTNDNIGPFIEWVAGQKISIALGMRDDYLLLSISDTLEHLDELGKEPALASVPVFRRIRERSETPLLTTYISAGLRPHSIYEADAVAEQLRAILPDYPGNKQLAQDVGTMLFELTQPDIKPAPYLTATYRNEGLESLTIDARQNQANSKKSLSLFANAGPSPTVAYASRAEPTIEWYKRWSHWSGVMLDHFETTVVAQMPHTNLTEFEKARRVFAPHLAEIDMIVQTVLLPAVDEHESLLVLDDTFKLELGPDLAPVHGISLPRLALMWRVQDCDQVLTAFARIRNAVEGMLQSASEQNGRSVGTLPPPTSTKTANGTLYAYELPTPNWLQPCFLVNGERILFALTPEHAQHLMQQSQSGEADVVDLKNGASSAASINIASLSELLRTNAMHLLRWVSQSEQIPAAQATLIWTHLEPALKALAALRSYQSRTWHEGDETIHHSWLKVSDGR
ncbi:MAG: hypothetical protein ACI91B_000175 [Planctomycetota bacterium]|jgi:hypothetical protein